MASWNPSEQLHSNDPTVFEQELAQPPLLVEHSLISTVTEVYGCDWMYCTYITQLHSVCVGACACVNVCYCVCVCECVCVYVCENVCAFICMPVTCMCECVYA